MRAFSNLANSQKKSSPLITQRELCEMAQLRNQLRKLTNRFDEKRSQIEKKLQRGADIERGKHWVWLKSTESMHLMLDE